jgi:uncharacterized damage-inducible protein DinB
VLTELSAYPNLAAIETWARPFYPLASAYAQTIEESRLVEPVDFPWKAMIIEKMGRMLPVTLSESTWQVFLHTSYHRGQISTRIRELGGEPPLIDYLYWVWNGRPAPQWASD